ncbi:hypothetical protein LTR56_008978 [Elasticomyces elasticus]|nr:hypothetical protein LTR22_024620 [Elasticomyces elasticus]KAK3645791.1 hypothetical protein LTR56_008978 [Elasticomyces elasticus]KAK4924105.1 hypothetical protein LTR49_008845 [Elasticomyces elasticus]KAK5764464.1 hypothetical protein LTS12_005440 [Elasticomyces elasticus]
MAIHPDLPGLDVTIDVNYEPLPEFDEHQADRSNSTACVKYVELVPGAEFGIATQLDPEIFPFADKCIYVEWVVDGEHHNHIRYHLDFCPIQPEIRRVNHGVVVGTPKGLVQYAMLFSELKIEEGEHDESLVSKLQALGTITVKIRRSEVEHREFQPRAKPTPRNLVKKVTKSIETPPPEEPEPDPMPLLPTGQVPEKNLKGLAISHQTSLGPACPLYSTRPPSHTLPDTGDPDEESPPPQPTTRHVYRSEVLATYVFKYRSHKSLQQLHIVPRTPSPPPPVPLEKRPLYTLSTKQMHELIQRQKAELADSQQQVKEIKKEMKRERDTSEDVDGDDGMEVVEHRNKKIRQIGGRGSRKDVIDLCSDD